MGRAICSGDISASSSRGITKQIRREVKRTKLPDIHDIVLIFQNSRLVVVHIKVIGRRKDSHDARESSCLGLPIHPVPCILCLMRTDDGQKVVLFEERASSGV